MTNLLYGAGSALAEDGRIYDGGGATTSPPDSHEHTTQRLVPASYLLRITGDGVNVGTGTLDADEQAIGWLLPTPLRNDGYRTVIGWETTRKLFITHGVTVVRAGADAASYCPFILERTAFTQENPPEPARESTVPEYMDNIPLALREALNAIAEIGTTAVTKEMENIPLALREALDAIAEIETTAEEEDCDPPSRLAISNTEVILRVMYDLAPQTYDIYPMGGGEIAIDGDVGERRIGVFCYPDGRIQYIGWVDDKRQEVREDSSENIPVDFLRRALNQPES